jgi:hypothetical protein
VSANISKYADHLTAHTCLPAAEQRAENLAILGVKSVLEMCVGPSLRDLEAVYAKYGITVTGNDIDSRWQDFYPKGKWLIGDARTLAETSTFDAVVVAPPLSKGCSGRRLDALSLEEVTPSYYDFLDLPSKIAVYVLPGKTLSIRADRVQLHRFLKAVSDAGRNPEAIPLRNKVVKYVDVYAL